MWILHYIANDVEYTHHYVTSKVRTLMTECGEYESCGMPSWLTRCN